MKIINELYVLRDGDDYILYAPLKRTVLTVSNGVIALLKSIKDSKQIGNAPETQRTIALLKESGIIDGDDLYPLDINKGDEYKPINVTFLPTSDCNLRCIYCYAESGKTSHHLSIDVAKYAIDFVITNAKEKDAKKIHVGFLGGGEPFLAWDFVQTIVDYSRNKANDAGLSILFSGVTNGMLSRQKVLWLSRNFEFLNVSFDGTKEIQDKHRPVRDGSSSFDTVANTVKYLNELSLKYAVRSTISSISLDQMVELVDFFSKDLGVKRIHLEPLFACGRCRNDSSLAPNPKIFSDNFKKCHDLLHSRKVELFCSAIRLDTLTSKFCGASGGNFYVTPEGYVTSCTEVSLACEPIAEKFFIGKFDHALKRFEFWKNQTNLLSSRTVQNMDNCKRCIAKWHCAGGCPAKAAYHGDMFDASKQANCEITINLTEFYIKQIARGCHLDLPRVNVKYMQ